MLNPKWIIRANGKILVEKTEAGISLPVFPLGANFSTQFSLPFTLIKSHPVNTDFSLMAAIASVQSEWPDGPYLWIGQRAAFAEGVGLNFTQDELPTFLKGLGVIEWIENHQFCGRCGAVNRLDLDEFAFHCLRCNVWYYPKMSPSILVRITRGNEILLARSAHFRPGMYSNVAGFIELGESAEDCVHREVQEEVGLSVHNIQYFGSQYWPFPNSFMLAYTAEYLSGDIEICPKEIEDAKWFTKDNLPLLPSTQSISGRLVAEFLSPKS